jgi:hypothetical protein
LRKLSAVLAVLMLTATAAVSSPFGNVRDLVMRKLSRRMPLPLGTAARRRAVTPPFTACPQKVLLQPVIRASALVLGGDSLYFSGDFDGIIRVAKDGGLPTVITPTIGERIGPLALDEANIYFITEDDDATGSLYSIPRSGGMPTQLAKKLPAPSALVIDANSIYWVNTGTVIGDSFADDGSVEKINKDGTGRQILANKLHTPIDLAIDATDVYVAEAGLSAGGSHAGVRRVSKSGGALIQIYEGSLVVSVTTSASDVFYSTLSEQAAAVFRVSKSGGMPQTLIDDVAAFTLTISDSKLYTAVFDLSGATSIRSVPALGGAMRIVANVDLDTGSFVLDDCAVYYAANLRLERAPR